jgi:hypothetical protein
MATRASTTCNEVTRLDNGVFITLPSPVSKLECTQFLFCCLYMWEKLMRFDLVTIIK